MSIDDYNPFAAPESGMEFVKPETTSDDAIRLKHIECEQNIRSIAQLMLVGATLFSGLTAFLSVRYWSVRNLEMVVPEQILLVLFYSAYSALAAMHLVVGLGLYRLRSWARRWAILISALWLFAIPVGTVIAGAAIFVLTLPNAPVVLTDEYQRLIARTPNVIHKTHMFSKVLALVTVIVLGLVVIMFG